MLNAPIKPSLDRSNIAPVRTREELIYLLSRASELEHDLACVYLYAAYSLKLDASEGGLTPEQGSMAYGWKRRLASVAVEEMLHLAQVSNLLTAIGGAPHFRRSNFPIPASAYPFGIEMSLEPFSTATIERLVCFEMPEEGVLSPERQRTYDEIRQRVCAPRSAAAPTTIESTTEPFDVDFRTVGEFYHKILTGFLTIPESVLFVGRAQSQASAAYLDLPKLVAVTDRASAQAAIDMIVEQGEAPTSDHPEAHFAVFDSIRKQFAQESALDPQFQAVRPVISNPMTRFYDDRRRGNVITDPLSHRLADLFNTSYDTMLLMLLRYFAHLNESEEELRLLSRGTLRIMASVLRPLGEALAMMPAGPEYPGKTAGPGFGYNRDIHLLAHKTAAWVFILERLTELTTAIESVAAEPGVPPLVDEAAAALQSVGDHLVRYIPRQFATSMHFHAAEAEAATSITPEPNGPYIVANLRHFTNSKGETLNTRQRLALCRCGGSRFKPYCDGTHARIGFASQKSPSRTPDKLDTYVAPDITIRDNRGTCCHAGNCTDHLAGVFRAHDEPFVNPTGADAASIETIVRQCPSGALSFVRNGVEYRGEEREPAIYVSKDGPYHVQGGVDLVGEQRNEGALLEHYALCRCGHSRNKPFCDGTHWYVKFKDDDN